MSVSNLFIPNNETIYCKKMVVDDIDIETLEIDNIIVDNATVLTQVTTPHINSGTSLFNTVDTININAINGTINNLNVPGTLTTGSFNPSLINTNVLMVNNNAMLNNVNISGTLTAASFNPADITCTNLTVTTTANIDTLNVLDTLNLDNNLLVPGDITCTGLTSTNLTSTSATINSLNVNTTINAPTISTNSITSVNGNISSLTSSVITTPNASINTLVGNGVTYGAGTITSLNGNDINYATGSIQSLNGSDINYSTAVMSTLTGSEFNYDVGYATGLSCKELRIFTQLVECPDAIITNSTLDTTNITTATIDTANITNLNVPGGLSVAGSVSAASFVSPSASISSLTLGSFGPTLSTPLSFYYYDTTNVTITGAATGTTIFFRGIRIGNAVTLQIGLPGGLTAVSNSQPINITIPVPFRNPTASCRGTCLMLKGASTIQATWATGVSAIQIYAGLLLSNFWNIGELCSFSEGGTWSFDWVV